MINVRWTAVFIGFLVDLLASLVIQLVAGTQFLTNPDVLLPQNLLVIGLLTFSTGVGGYVAGRMASQQRAVHGLLVGAIGVLLGVLGGSNLPRPLVIASAVGCLLAACGGYLARLPAANRSGSPGER